MTVKVTTVLFVACVLVRKTEGIRESNAGIKTEHENRCASFRTTKLELSETSSKRSIVAQESIEATASKDATNTGNNINWFPTGTLRQPSLEFE
eukprot:5455297-Amphidinium_carterae.2